MGCKPAARHIEVRGTVQGVGFRPFVYRLARELGLKGWVRNTSGSVAIHVEGPAEALESFQGRLVGEAPPLARVESLTSQVVPSEGLSRFAIDVSEEQLGQYQPVSPDIATCADCLRELCDPEDRRHLYPFINCTNCGPRYTIVERVPYDRATTTMKGFSLCDFCRRQYEDPEDRRFHAQPVACPQCGPHLWLEGDGVRLLASDAEVVAEAARLLVAGKIVGIKGLGGFHLAADATNRAALEELRRRKNRPDRALALMVPDVDAARSLGWVSPAGEEALLSPAGPIVVVPARGDGWVVRELVAPDNDTLGVMLPYTPLHHMLLRAVRRPLVMTSGNLSEEPLAVDNEEAQRRLGSIADAFVMHDRPIHMPCDDSVVQQLDPEAAEGGGTQMVRRARGFSPSPIRIGIDGPQVLAVGPEMKSTVCVVRDQRAFLSQHIGDLWNLETWQHFLRIVEQFQDLFAVHPEVIAHDLHPDYMSTGYALARSRREGLRAVPVQHHRAHALSCLTEAGVDFRSQPVLAVVFDGTGYGSDGRIWGGEWLLLRGACCERLAHLEYMPLAGGEAAIERVDRLAAGYFCSLGALDSVTSVPGLAHLSESERLVIEASLRGGRAPETSSAGRLFGVVAALLGLAREVTYEAQAAVRLETAAASVQGADTTQRYEWERRGPEVRVREVLSAIVGEVLAGFDRERVALRFHCTLADMVSGVCAGLASDNGAEIVGLSGGCFQNRLLTRLCVTRLREVGLRPVIHREVPPNDGGVALGQAVAARLWAEDQSSSGSANVGAGSVILPESTAALAGPEPRPPRS